MAKMVAQKHGGALQEGNEGNAGGGRPSNKARQLAATALEGIMAKAVSAAEGPVTIPFKGVCSKCGAESAGAEDQQVTLFAYGDHLQRLADLVAKYQPKDKPLVDETFVTRLGNVVSFALQQEDSVEDEAFTRIMEYVENAWNKMIHEHNLNVLNG